MSQTTNVSNLVINKMTKQQYSGITPSSTELYFITDDNYVQYEEVDSGSAPPISISGGGTNATTTAQAILNLGIYPIGSIYLSTSSSFSPSAAFGGTWERIKDTFLLAAGDTYSGGTTGGEATHTLTESEMPSHNHSPSESQYGEFWIHSTNSTFGSNSVASGSGHYVAASSYTQNTGGGQSHNNMPPYLAVYVWQRTA